jgi:hypothetical protein
MAGTTDTTIASAINKYVDGVWDTLDSRATPLSDFAGYDTNVVGDSVDWVANSAGNTSSTTFVATDAPSAAGYQEYYAMTLAKASFQYRTMVQITGTAIDSARGGYFDVIAGEMTGAMLDHKSYLEDALVTNFEAAIDSAGSYAGQTRANANMASLETAVTPTVAQMNAMHSAMIADPRSANWSTLQLLAPIEFQLSYAVVAAGATAYELNAQQGGVVDAGKLSGISFSGKPFTTIGTMTDTTMLILAPDNCTQKVWRAIQTDIMAKNDDSITVSLTSVQVPVVWNPRIAGKLT